MEEEEEEEEELFTFLVVIPPCYLSRPIASFHIDLSLYL